MKKYTVDLFDNSGIHATGELQQWEFASREEAEGFCKSFDIPNEHHLAIGEWEGNELISLDDWNNI